MKLRARRRALELFDRHPGWSDRHVARAVGVSPSTASRWRWQAGYAPALKHVGNQRRRRRLV